MDREHAMFVKRLAELMEEVNISEIELAKKVDTTNVTISRYLSGKRKPRIEIASKIANVFSVSTDYLLGRSDIRNPESKDDLFISLYSDYKEMDEEDKEILMNMWKAIKRRKK